MVFIFLMIQQNIEMRILIIYNLIYPRKETVEADYIFLHMEVMAIKETGQGNQVQGQRRAVQGNRRGCHRLDRYCRRTGASCRSTATRRPRNDGSCCRCVNERCNRVSFLIKVLYSDGTKGSVIYPYCIKTKTINLFKRTSFSIGFCKFVSFIND